jgi:hypothetical protein
MAGVRGGLVVGPGAAPQLLQAGDRAVVADDDVGIVDGAAAVAVARQDRGGQRLDRRRPAGGQPHIGQPADHPQVGFALLELAEGAANHQLDRAAQPIADPRGQEPVDGQHVGRQEGREPQRRTTSAGGHGCAIGRWVSYMRTATTRPEAAIRPVRGRTGPGWPATPAAGSRFGPGLGWVMSGPGPGRWPAASPGDHPARRAGPCGRRGPAGWRRSWPVRRGYTSP